ncbi:glycosyltransferase, partial [Patescibacteria group bacterium]
MKVALVHDWLVVDAGSEKVLKALSEIYPEAPIYTCVYNSKKVPYFKDKKVHTSFLQNFPKAKENPQIYLPLMLKAYEGFDFSKYDLVISSSHAFAKGIKTSQKTLHICYCHYPLRYVWEPDIDPRLSTNIILILIRNYLKKPDLKASQRPNMFIANSKNTALKIKKHYKREAVVIYPPVDIDRFKPSMSPSKDYFLLASRLVYYKNPQLVIKVFNKLGIRLKVVGSGPEKNKLRKLANKNIQFLGRVSDNDLVKLYANCKALIFPGEEDFGIMPVEVMASGRPILALEKGGVKESVIKGKCGDFFKDNTENSLQESLKKFDFNKYKKEDLINRSEDFSEKRFKNNIEKFIE